MNSNRAKHEHFVGDVGKAGVLHDRHQLFRLFELLRAVGEVVVGVGFASDQFAEGGDDVVEVEFDKRP